MSHPEPLAQILIPRTADLGNAFYVKRVLPSRERRMVGPYVFLDQMGPKTLAPGEGLDVRPHPHIGLATVTYLYDGEMIHRDSVGAVQAIQPGAVNGMTAGRGIAHSERSSPAQRAGDARRHAEHRQASSARLRHQSAICALSTTPFHFFNSVWIKLPRTSGVPGLAVSPCSCSFLRTSGRASA